ncbi:MAG: LysM peptidoglycan-binding domain-containing protein [Anaerovoracaceae bacterium]
MKGKGIKGHRIKSKPRFILFILFVMMATMLIAANSLGTHKVSGMEPTEYRIVNINPGDTIWSLAQTHGPQDMDIRQVVKVICAYNDTSPERLQPGQTIFVPQRM